MTRDPTRFTANQDAGVPIDTSVLPTRPSRRRLPPTVIAVAVAAMGAVLVAAIFFFTPGTPHRLANQAATPKQRTAPGKRSESLAGDGTTRVAATADRPSPEETIPDDGRTLWASPTGGPPLSLRYLPIGTQIVIALRPADLIGHVEGERVLASIGPIATQWQRRFEQLSQFQLTAVDRLIIGLEVDPSRQIDATMVLHPQTPVDLTELASRHAQAATAMHAGTPYLTSGQWAFYLPADQAGRVVVVAKTAVMPEIIDAAGPPPLRRAMERLLATTDTGRTLTLLVPPNYLLTDAVPLLAGPAARLRGPLGWLLSDSIEAASLSVHLDRDLFLELRACGPVDRSPADLADRLRDRLDQIPDRVESYLIGLNPRPYGRRILGRLPHMLQILTNYTRTGTDEGQALLRCYLPASAAHNLLMGIDLTLCEGASTTTAAGASPARQGSLADRLARKTTLQFDRDTLQHAVELLSNDTGIPITILGGDLQLEGITKNQSFALDAHDLPAEEILQRIVQLANPDKTVKQLSDPNQTLIYVIRPDRPGETGRVVITTRKQAAARGEQLPEAFE